jgi:regulator of nucleoside diphosphate kinase
MTPETIALNILGLFLLAAIGLLFTGGRLLRHDRNRTGQRDDVARPPSNTLEHLRPIQNLTVEFFARTAPCARLLRVLIAHEYPLKRGEALRKAGAAKGHNPDFGIGWAALWIMRLTGLVTFSRRVIVTDIGHEVHRRITNPSSPRIGEDRSRESVYDSLFFPVPADTDASSHIRRVREALHQQSMSHLVPRTRVATPIKIGELRKPLRSVTASHQSPNSHSTQTTSMKKRTIIMTAADHEELTCAIAATGKLSERGRSETNALEAEIARAQIVDASDLLPNVITMNSRAELLDLDTGERMEFTLVFPIDADIEAGKISILAPLGTAMLGYRVGDEFEWAVPYGLRRLKVTHVHFQPEAALAMAA